MFPIPFNFPFRKKDGSITTMDDAISSGGGSYTLPTASADTKGGVKVGAGLTMDGETLKNSNPTPFTLPTASAETLGGVKVGSGLSIDDGVLSTAGGGGGVAKIYYKDFSLDNVIWSKSFKLTGTASDSSTDDMYYFYPTSAIGVPDLSINGYSPINAELIDKFTGYRYVGGFSLAGNPKQFNFSYVFTNRNSLTGALAIRVYYVANGDISELT